MGTRKAKDMVEHAEVMFQSLKGGRDTSQRPDFYVPYSAAYALAYQRYLQHLHAVMPLYRG